MATEEIKLDEKNYRIHDEKNLRLIGKSLTDCGAGRSILIDSEGCIIAGNGVYRKAQDMGLPVRVIESDGTELIAIKRTDLATEDNRRKALALADNYTSDTSVFDIDLVIENFSTEELDAWEFSISNINLNDPNAEFDNFGEFEYKNKDMSAWKQIIVSFEDENAFKLFCDLTGLKITDKTRSTWFPQKENEKMEDVYG
ncbi:MAG: hypothetical protein LBS43_09185 [Prevotellaceae bacterium]|nr:hypothetical protein [Prevotellaceae bacterium]